MALETWVQRRIMEALTQKEAGRELIDAVNTSSTLSAQSNWSMPAAIVATSTSTTTDFAALKVGDLVIHIPATAGDADFTTCATAGTLAEDAVVGDLYVALRAVPATAATTTTL